MGLILKQMISKKNNYFHFNKVLMCSYVGNIYEDI